VSDEPEVVDGEVTPDMADAASEIEDYMPQGADLALADSNDPYETAVVMDAHDVALLMERVQSSALKKWVYDMDGKQGLSVSAVQDVTQLMNWMGKAKITLDRGSLTKERIVEDMGNGPEPLWLVTIFAVDEMTGDAHSGTSMEPVMMRLTPETAEKWRRKGKEVPEDRRVFDVYSLTKAIQKATRNALKAFIPQEVEQTIIAMYSNDPARVEKIHTPEEAKAADLPAPLETPEAKALMQECDEIYARIKDISPEARVRFTPGRYHALMVRSHHDMQRLADFREYLLEQEQALPVAIENDRIAREARETVLEAVCPVCGQGRSWRCKQLDAQGEPVLRKEKPVLMNVPHAERVAARAEELRS